MLGEKLVNDRAVLFLGALDLCGSELARESVATFNVDGG